MGGSSCAGPRFYWLRFLAYGDDQFSKVDVQHKVRPIGKTRKKMDFIQFKYIIMKCIHYTIIWVYIVVYILYVG